MFRRNILPPNSGFKSKTSKFVSCFAYSSTLDVEVKNGRVLSSPNFIMESHLYLLLLFSDTFRNTIKIYISYHLKINFRDRTLLSREWHSGFVFRKSTIHISAQANVKIFSRPLPLSSFPSLPANIRHYII
jgi:hypothetical protein